MADLWICETGTGQQVAQLHDRYDDDDENLHNFSNLHDNFQFNTNNMQ